MASHESTLHPTDAISGSHALGDGPARRGRHRLLMAMCFAPLLVLAVLLIVTGVVEPTLLLVAMACIVMMVVMMSAIRRSDSGHGRHRP
jgi:hypothetical protein